MNVAPAPTRPDGYVTITGTLDHLMRRISPQGRAYATAQLNGVPIEVPPRTYEEFGQHLMEGPTTPVTAAGRWDGETGGVFLTVYVALPAGDHFDLDKTAGLSWLLLHAASRARNANPRDAATAELLSLFAADLAGQAPDTIHEGGAPFAAVQLACSVLELPAPLTWEDRNRLGAGRRTPDRHRDDWWVK